MGMTKYEAKRVLEVFTCNKRYLDATYYPAVTTGSTSSIHSEYYVDADRAIYAGLSTADPTYLGTGAVEPNDSAYARVILGHMVPAAYNSQSPYASRPASPNADVAKMKDAVIDATYGATGYNSAQITFPKASADWGEVKYLCFYDAATGGNLLWYGELNPHITPVKDKVVLLEETDDAGNATLMISLDTMTDTIAKTLINEVDCRTGHYGGTALYLGLSTTAPDHAGYGFNEPTDTAYKRVPVAAYADNADAGNTNVNVFAANSTDDGTYVNTKQIAFNRAHESWGECKYACLFDAKTGGSLLWYGELTNSITPVAGDVAIVEPKGITLKIS